MDSQTSQALNEAFKQLKDPTTINRLWGVRKIGEIGVNHPRLVEQLQGMAQNDPDEGVRAAALESLAALQSHPSQELAPAPQTMPAPIPPPAPARGAVEQEILALLQRQTTILENIQTLLTFASEAPKKDRYNILTRVTDIDMSIGAMANFMLKWLIASIPVAIILGIVAFVVTACTASLGRY